MMTFKSLASYFQKLEDTSSRNSMVDTLSSLFKEADPSEINKIAYLSQGRVAPLFIPLEFGMADKMVAKAMVLAYGKSAEEVLKVFKKEGDLGVTAEFFAKEKGWEGKDISIEEVFEILTSIANSSGQGSVEQKVTLLAELFAKSDPLSVRYLARIPVGKLRLGFSDMTVLDALAWMCDGSKKGRPAIERAYNIHPDLGFIAQVLRTEGVAGLAKTEPEVGVPIIMARAERLPSPQDIIGKIGRCAVEPKIDGFRVAVHKDGDSVRMFSRNMEETTAMYPDLAAGVIKQVKAKKIIIEGEAIAYNPKTLEYLPFQETVQRKRKYDIEKMAEEVPLKLVCFDCLYIDGENLINKGYEERRRILEGIIGEGETLVLSEKRIVDNAEDLEKIFQEAIGKGLEGIMAKRLDGVYQAGARGWNWIKYKRSYQGKLDDTIDAVVMGYDYGQGKRASFGIGDFLIGVYDKEADLYKTIAKIGTGLTDQEWREMKSRCDALADEEKPAIYDVDKLMACDVWVKPEMVVVIRADEISLSPVHTAGRSSSQPGFALRFPRLVDFRDDKRPEDATTVKELEEMFELQFNGKGRRK